MEPESHRLDREGLLADRRVVAERVRREVDEAVAAAAQKRSIFFEAFMNRMRLEAQAQRDRARVVAGSQAAPVPGHAKGSSRVASGASQTEGRDEIEVEPRAVASAVGAG